MSHETGDTHHSTHHTQDDDQSLSGHHAPHSFAEEFTHMPHWSHDPGHHVDEHPFLGDYHPHGGEHATHGPDDHAPDARHQHSVSDTWITEVEPSKEDYFGSE
jgi:hypothetical protein